MQEYYSFTTLCVSITVILSLFLFKPKREGSFDITRNILNEPWKAYAKLSKQTSTSIVFVKTSGKNAVVLNDLQCATELLEKRWSNYSSRPWRPLLHLMGREDNVGLQRYGPRLTKCRKLIHETLNSRHFEKQDYLESLIEAESISFLKNLSKMPGQFSQLTLEFIATLIFKLTYGHGTDAEHVRLLEITTKYTNESMVPGKWLVDSYPFLQYLPTWVPGCGFKTWASKARSQFKLLTERPFNKVKDEIRKGVAPSSFVRDNLLAFKGELSMESIIAGTAASFHSAGTDTIGTAILTFILMMVAHPEIQKKAHEEIISATGPGRLPTMTDCKSLPYLTAIMKEVHRFNPAVPMAIRSAEKADEYSGKSIPNECWVFVNLWAMTHDEAEYKNPHLFYPERFLDSEVPLRDPRDIIFGFARRRCPGVALANSTLIVTYARLLAAFHMQPPSNSQGQPIPPNVEFSTGFTAPPKVFNCVFKPRSLTFEELIAKD